MKALEGLKEIERATLACMLSSQRVASRVADMLLPSDFVDNDHRILFAVMVDMLDEGDRLDDVAVRAELRKEGHEDEVIAVLNAVMGVATTLVTPEAGPQYAENVRDESVRRQLGLDVDDALREGDVEESVSLLEAATFAARARMLGEEGRTLTAASILSPLESFLSASETRGGFPYPLPSLRAEYGEYERGRYTILAGHSGDGKTTFAMQWVEELCEAGARVCVYELEMTELQTSRMLALQGAGITTRQAKRLEPMSQEDMLRFEERKARIAGWDLTVKCGATTPQQIRAEQAREKYDVIFVDHMKKFPRTRAGEYADLTNYSSQLHRISRDLDCSVVALHQLRKPGTDSRTGMVVRPEPSTASLHGSGAMEEDADDVLFVYQERDVNDRRLGHGSLIVAKMRDGQADGQVAMRFMPNRVMFVEEVERAVRA